jgi:hypothetical protein
MSWQSARLFGFGSLIDRRGLESYEDKLREREPLSLETGRGILEGDLSLSPITTVR